MPYGDLLEATRATMAPARGLPLIARVILAVFSNHLLLRTALRGARAFRATGLPRVLARLLPRRLAFPMAMLASTSPTRIVGSRSSRSRSAAAPHASPSRVSLLDGCVMSGLFAHVNDATHTALQANGFTPCTTSGQRCCGALHAHAGDLNGQQDDAFVDDLVVLQIVQQGVRHAIGRGRHEYGRSGHP